MKTRLRHVAKVNPLSSRFDRLADDELVTFLPMENVWPGDQLDLSQSRPKSAVATGYTRFESGDVVVPKITPTFEASRSVLVPDIPHSVGAGTTELHVVRPGPEIDPRYLLYIFHSHDFLKLGAAEMYGVAGQKRVPDELIRDWIVDLPPLDEQRRIADFLDAETARIDQLVSLRNTQVDRLSEALHSEAGRIADSEWRRVPLRRIVEKVQTGTTPTEILRPADSSNIPWYTPAALGGTLDLNDADKSIRKEDILTVPRFPAESILIVGIGESLCKIADLDHEATGNQQLTAIRTSATVDRRFVAWRLFAAYEELRAWAQYSRVRILNNEVLKSFSIPIPSLEQQIEVRKDLDHRLAHFTEFREAAVRFSLLASERRQALITAAVTGQIDVTTARGVAV
jgi:type I restriction enzyme S subunit